MDYDKSLRYIKIIPGHFFWPENGQLRIFCKKILHRFLTSQQSEYYERKLAHITHSKFMDFCTIEDIGKYGEDFTMGNKGHLP
jgi:hypothetical protein